MYTSSRVIFHMSYMSGSIANSELWLECLIASLGAITKDIIKHKVGWLFVCMYMYVNKLMSKFTCDSLFAGLLFIMHAFLE